MRARSSPATRQAVFLDLNGTLVTPVQVSSPDHYQALAGVVQAVQLLNQAGFLCPVITVQSRIGKGLYSAAQFLAWFHSFQQALAAQGASLVGPYICPHRFQDACSCGKPQSTLYQAAAKDFSIDCSRSYAIGDTNDDIQAARLLGAQGCLVLTGWGARQSEQVKKQAAFVGANIWTVVQWIVTNTGIVRSRASEL